MKRSRVRRFLRSPRLAAGLILALIVYCPVSTLVPQSAVQADDVTRFALEHPALAVVTRALGLHEAFTAAPFLLVVTLLALSTAVCAWERTAHARTALRGGGTIAPGLLRRLRERPMAAARVADGEEALSRLADEFTAMRLRVRRGPKLIEAGAGRIGVFGSPVFHWSLALLILVIGVGQSTRAEGLLGVPVGRAVTDSAENYRDHHAGWLYPGHSRLSIEASDLILDFVDESGQKRGPAPVVSLRRDGRVVARGRVHPNSPLRHGSLLVHMVDYGFSPVISLETSAGRRMGRHELLIARPSGPATETASETFEVSGAGVYVPVSASLLRTDRGRRVEDLRLRLVLGDGGSLGERVIGAGETVVLPSGDRLRLEEVTHHVRLSVADDRSVLPMYALFGTAALGLALSVLFPPKRAWALLTTDAHHAALHVVTRHGRGDPLFEERVAEALHRAARLPAEEEASA